METLIFLSELLLAIGVPLPVSQALVQMARASADPAKLAAVGRPARPAQPMHDRPLGEVARWLHRESLRRADVIGRNLLHDPAWNMLLALFADREEGRRVSVTSLIHASGAPATTGLRHLARMEQQGLIRRSRNVHDARSWLVEPTDQAVAMMREAVSRSLGDVERPADAPTLALRTG